jgi:hypothetical protein
VRNGLRDREYLVPGLDEISSKLEAVRGSEDRRSGAILEKPIVDGSPERYILRIVYL